jgi:hypothetical protein
MHASPCSRAGLIVPGSTAAGACVSVTPPTIPGRHPRKCHNLWHSQTALAHLASASTR